MSDGGWGSGPWGGSAWGKSYFLPTVSEAAAGADTQRQGFLVDRSVSEGAVGTDAAPLAGWAYNITVQEGATALDRVVAQMRFEVEINEQMLARETVPAKFLWDPVNDNQTTNWQNVANAQTPGWTDVNDAQPPRWRDIEP